MEVRRGVILPGLADARQFWGCSKRLIGFSGGGAGNYPFYVSKIGSFHSTKLQIVSNLCASVGSIVVVSVQEVLPQPPGRVFYAPRAGAAMMYRKTAGCVVSFIQLRESADCLASIATDRNTAIATPSVDAAALGTR